MPYIAPEVVQEAKWMDLLTYLKNYEPYELVHFSGNTYTTKSHDSLKISNGKWMWWSRGIGGRSAVDYLIKVRDYTFMEAVQTIAGQAAIAPPVSLPAEKTTEKKLLLPKPNRYQTQVVSYLNRCGIDTDIIGFCLQKGMVFESENHHNAVFVGMDKGGKPRYAALRGIGIIIYTQFLLTALYIGFSMGVAPVISYNYGKQDNAWLKKVFSICMRFIILVSIVIFGMAIAFGSPLVSLFSEKRTYVYEIARRGFLIFPFSFLFCGMNIFTSATFTALSNGKLSAVLSFLRTFGLIFVLLLILPEFMGVTGVWLAVPIAELLTMVVALAFLYQNKDRYHYA